MMAFQYYEVRPVIEENGTCTPYCDEAEFLDAVQLLNLNWGSHNAFYTIYGRYEADGVSEVQAIGDFATKDDALAVLNAMLALPAKARDVLDAGNMVRMAPDLHDSIKTASAILDDMINQSSNAERL